MDLKNTLKNIKLHESTISMVLGAIVIVFVGVLLINYFSKRQGGGQIVPSLDIENETQLPATHTVQAGEDLWKISEKYYGTGYNWQDIASANNLADPNDLEAGQTLTIPDVEPKIAEAVTTIQPTISPLPTYIPKGTPETLVPQGTKTHKVQKDENLWKIAEMYYKSGYNWVDIARENNLQNPSVLEVDQTLRIPEVSPKTATLIGQNTQNSTQAISGSTYTVQHGDSLWSIAVRAYGDGFRWTDVAKENKLVNPSLIHSGNTLTLPR